MNSYEVYKNYIEGIDISNIKYINLTNDELMNFYIENYYDNKNIIIAGIYDDSKNIINPIGMYYLNFENMPGMKYILGIVNNNINKKTIVSALVYCDEYKMFSNQKGYITYLSTVETNKYFRNRGLYRDLINNSFKFINPNQNILISEISNMGKRCKVYNSFVQIFSDKGFEMNISNENDNFNRDLYFDLINNVNYIKVRKKV